MSFNSEIPDELAQVIRESGERETQSFRANTEQSLKSVHARIDRSRFTNRIPRWIPAVAAASLIAVLGWSLMQSGVTGSSTYATARGEHKTYTLADGSEMILGPESRVNFLTTSRSRRVELEGEGYFRVKHDEGAPFVVTARNAVATDIGTEFSVRAYPEDSTVDVAVAEGVVALAATSNEKARTILNKGKVGSVSRDMMVTSSVGDISSYTSWAEKRLVFRNAPISTIARELSRWYNVDITVGADLATRRLTAVYDNATLDQVLEAISLTTGANVQRSGTAIHLGTQGTP